MPINPCGHIVDYARRPYSTRVKFFRDNDTKVTLAYYPALPTARNLPFPTAFVNQVWDKEPWRIEGVGEEWLVPTPYNGRGMNPAALGRNYCGTPDEFLNGVIWDPSRPPTQYDNSGLPFCCGGPVGTVGISYGGEAIVSVPYPIRGLGGISYGGEAIVHGGTLAVTGSGGISYGGEALVYVIPIDVGSGGISYGGEALTDIISPPVSEGGISYGGEALTDIISPPGPTCETAANTILPFAYTGTIHPTGDANWWTFTAPVTGTYHMRNIVNSGDGILNTYILVGTCPSPTEWAVLSNFVIGVWECVEFTLTADEVYFIFVSQPFASGPENYSIEVALGVCPS